MTTKLKAQSARAQGADAAEAVAQLVDQLKIESPSLVLAFSAAQYNPHEVAAKLQAAYPQATILGCTTAGEIVDGAMLQGHVVALALDSEVVEVVGVEVVKGLKAGATPDEAVRRLAQKVGQPARDWDFGTYVGLALFDGLAGAEERFLDRLGDLTEVLFTGGSAGDELTFTQTCVLVGDDAVEDAAVLALLKPKHGFRVVKTQSARPLGKKLTVTASDPATRRVLAFNGKPAIEAYAEALGCSVEEAATRFHGNPLGLYSSDELFIRSPHKTEDGAMQFFCNLLEGMELELLEATDIVADTAAALAADAAEHGAPSAVVDFHCILRTLWLRGKGETEAYGQTLKGCPAVGFSTYGEVYLGHVNQTSTMLVLA